MPIRCGHCRDSHGTVAEVRACATNHGMPTIRNNKPLPVRPARIEVTEGMWVTGPTQDQTIWKVQVAHHGSGRLYAKRLEMDFGSETWSFSMSPGGIRTIQERGGRKMTIEEARGFGKLYGFCVRCAAILTDEQSIAEGIGPVCKTKF